MLTETCFICGFEVVHQEMCANNPNETEQLCSEFQPISHEGRKNCECKS